MMLHILRDWFAGEEDQTIKALRMHVTCVFKSVQDVFIFGTHGLTQSKDTSITYVAPELVKDRYGDARNLLLVPKNLLLKKQ